MRAKASAFENVAPHGEGRVSAVSNHEARAILFKLSKSRTQKPPLALRASFPVAAIR
jgi:hypothetical protein